MKKILLITGLLLTCLLALSGCNDDDAKKVFEKEQKAAQLELQEARDLEAPKYAPEKYQAAEDKYDEGVNFFQTKEYESAYQSLKDFKPLVSDAKKQAVKAKKLEEKLKAQAEEKIRMAMLAKEKREKELEAQRQAEANKVRAHNVQEGEYLWKIAEEKYNDPFKWTEIYEANKDIIKDPRLIYPGQKLKMPN